MGARERKTKKSLIDDPGEEEKYTPETDSVRYTAEVSTGFFFLVGRGKEGELSRVMLLVKMAPLSLSCSSPERTQPGVFLSPTATEGANYAVIVLPFFSSARFWVDLSSFLMPPLSTPRCRPMTTAYDSPPPGASGLRRMKRVISATTLLRCPRTSGAYAVGWAGHAWTPQSPLWARKKTVRISARSNGRREFAHLVVASNSQRLC